MSAPSSAPCASRGSGNGQLERLPGGSGRRSPPSPSRIRPLGLARVGRAASCLLAAALYAHNRRERHSRRLNPGRRRPAGAAALAPFRFRLGRLRRAAGTWAAACLLGLAAPGLAAAPAAADSTARLLTGLTAEAGPAGVRLAWTVDESRAGRIAGFSCVYLSPAHLKLGVAGTVPCGSEDSTSMARTRTVAGLPEYGEYLFEVVAEEAPGGPGIPWPERALHVRVTVTEALAGPAGPARAVTGAGPLVEGCGPDGDARPWRLDETVSAAHLTHYPGRGWSPAGDPAAAPEWPDPTPIAALIRDAGLDPAPIREALSGTGTDSAALARTLGDARFEAALARAGAGTKALLRPAPDGGHELKLHSSYPFGAAYRFEDRHAVPGWGRAGHPAAWPGLWNRVDCPPPGAPGATHDVALALSDAAGDGRRLAHSGYGWWAVAPVGLFPGRIVATQGGLSFGAPVSGMPAGEAPEAGARWTGRLAGHLFRDRRRWAVAGEVSLWLLPGGGAPRLAGRVENLILTPMDAKSLEPAAGPDARLPALVLGAGNRTQGAGPDGAWSGALTLKTAGDALDGVPAAGAFRGDWLAALHGPGGAEAAGRLRLWTPLPAGADPVTDWPRQAVLVAGFGAARRTAP